MKFYFPLILSFFLFTSSSSSSISSTKSSSLLLPRFPASVLEPENLFSINNNKKKINYQTKYFTQTLDHFNFNPISYQTFQQRYLVDDSYWAGPNSNAPVFVYTGNEGDIEWFAENTGFVYEIAPIFKALLVFLEHRYYGKSIPFGGDKDVAYSNSSTLGYLSSTQALADYATLITHLKTNLSAADSPVVVLGGSYGGMLAAWFRLKYPHLTIGALASSAPILYFDSLVSPYSFYNVIGQDFKSTSENCYKVIKEGWEKIEEKAKTPHGLKQLQKSFGICQNNFDGDDLESWLGTAFIYTAMTDYPTPSNFMAPLPAYPIKQMCKAIDDPRRGSDIFGKLYGAANIYYNYTGTVSCFDLADSSDPHGLGGWRWQACTEMVMPVGGNDKSSIFPASDWHYSDRDHFCRYNYGVHPRPHWITTEFGGNDIKRVLKRFGSNIIFFNGLRDPWSAGGVLKNISSTIIAIVAKEGAHHVDLRSSTKQDPKWLRDVRNQEVKIIAGWISQYYHDLAHN